MYFTIILFCLLGIIWLSLHNNILMWFCYILIVHNHWIPCTTNMNFANWLVLCCDIKPLIDSTRESKGGNIQFAFSQDFIISLIINLSFNYNFFILVIYVYRPRLVLPDWFKFLVQGSRKNFILFTYIHCNI